MARYLRILPLALLLIIARPALAGQAEALVQALADTDPQKRSAAEAELTKLGPAARPDLIQACRGNDPAVAAAAAQLLLAMPWDHPEDPADVREILRNNYGRLDDQGREILVTQNPMFSAAAALPTRLRLMLEDPSEDVCWAIAGSIRRSWDAQAMAEVRKLDPPDVRPAALTLAGNAWRGVDHAKLISRFERAVQAEWTHPTNDGGELGEAFDALAGDAVVAGDYDRAAKWRRMQAARAGQNTGEDADPARLLFILHARYGPLKGFEEDVQEFTHYMGDPVVLYALSKVYARSGQFGESMAMETAAQTAGLTAESHLEIAAYFSRGIGWNTFARQEAYAALDAPLGNPERLSLLGVQFATREVLASLAAGEGEDADDESALAHRMAARDLLNQNGALSAQAAENLQAQIALHQARLARAKGDQKQLNECLDNLIAARPGKYSDVVLNAYPLLKSAGRVAEAQALFDEAYAIGLQQIKDEPEYRQATFLNSLAWMSARCDQRLKEALEMAQRAVSLEPDNAALIDTLAEVNYRIGNPRESARLEALALRLRPEDEFMTGQVQKFRAAIDHPELLPTTQPR